GELAFAIGMSEPDSGSDLASIRTRATKTDGGYLVNGTKVWTSNAHLSDYAISLFRTQVVPDKKHEGLTQFLVDLRDTPGITIRPIIDLAGKHHFNEVNFTDAFVPDQARVGSDGDGWKQVTTELGSLLSDTVTRLCTDLATKELIEAAEKGTWPDKLWRALEEGGLTLPLVPEESGGAGGTWLDAHVVVRASGRHTAPVPLAETI